jgi:hypothetical protein
MSDTTIFTQIKTAPIFGTNLFASGFYDATYDASGALISVTGDIIVDNPISHAISLFTLDTSVSGTGGGQYTADFVVDGTNNLSIVGHITELDLVWNTETPTAYAGTYPGSGPFSLVIEGGGPSLINSNDTGTLQNFPCYAAGTLIRTVDGEIAVENLAEGQLVVTASGTAKPIRWIGRRTVNVRRHADPATVRPIRIAAGALAEGVPARDLLVSPDHAMLVDGALIPARLLVNNRSITEATDVKIVTYFHVELDSHDIIIAEGAQAESFLDTGNRAVFANTDVSAMNVDLSVAQRLRMPAEGACMPLVTDPEAVFPIWQRIADRAGLEVRESIETAGGHGDVRLIADGRTLRPVVTEGDRLIFALPRDTSELRLVSTAVRPSMARPWLDDRRDLGVAVKSIMADHATVALDSPALGTGWWDVEHAGMSAFRWTNGDAGFALPKGTKLLSIRLHAATADAEKPVLAHAA